nr:RNA-directed DNA polymerase, eukaryota, reverse transcriptase zinc-binding domain protein [Tanacetum cinerariifolium]
MFSVPSWNIKGLNCAPKQKEVFQVVNENNLSVCAILESHVDVSGVYDTCKKACHRWKWTSNGSICNKGSRIILGWNDDIVDVIIMAQTNQVMHVQPYRISDHSPCVVRIPTVTKPKPKPFKFSNFLVYKEGFCEVVESGWNPNVDGFVMYRVVKRLKGLKSPFRKLLHTQGNLHNRVDFLRKELDVIQKAIDKEPNNSDLREEHAHYLLAFKEASLDEERFLRQKSKIKWLKLVILIRLTFIKLLRVNVAVIRLKCKIIANRIKGNLDDLVSINQSAFILGRKISDNILRTQELMRNYHRKRGPPRLDRVVSLLPLIRCVLMGIFMAGFEEIEQKVDDSKVFQFHHLCEKQKIINICFADDLFLFARGHPSSVDVIMQGLEEFKNISGLVSSIPKSTAFLMS